MSGIPSDSEDDILVLGLLALGLFDAFPPALEKISSSDDEDDNDDDEILLLCLLALGLLDAFLPALEKLSSSDDDDNDDDDDDDDNDDGLFRPCKKKGNTLFSFYLDFFLVYLRSRSLKTMELSFIL